MHPLAEEKFKCAHFLNSCLLSPLPWFEPRTKFFLVFIRFSHVTSGFRRKITSQTGNDVTVRLPTRICCTSSIWAFVGQLAPFTSCWLFLRTGSGSLPQWRRPMLVLWTFDSPTPAAYKCSADISRPSLTVHGILATNSVMKTDWKWTFAIVDSGSQIRPTIQ